ncbi:7602_t:CDS:1 [Entrophospora sp. SA101]|nr:7602_t:CDS:1 [Entrophospora sp. SA101]
MDAFANESTLTFLKAYRGENIRVIDNKFQPLIGKTIEYLPDPNTGAEAMRIGFEYLKQGKRVAFVVTSSNMARALVEKASKLSFKARAYYGDMDGKQRKNDFLDINTAWGELDCVAYTNTVEAGISFEKPNHFDIVIGITNIATPVNVEAFIQMMFRIRDCEKRILSLFYQKNSNELSRTPGHENIRAELAIARPNDLPTAIKGHREWDKDSISYKLDQSPAVTSFVEVEHQKRLSARNFIEISCSLIASTGASLKLIKMDESRGVIGIRKKVRNEIRAEVSVIKHTDFDAVATSRNLTPEEAEFLKLDSERSVADTMALKRFYMWNLYDGNGMSIEDWNKLCDKDFVERFSPPEPRKHFLHLSHFYKQGYDEESAIEELKAKDIAQWEDTCYNAKDNFEDSVAKDLRKTYSANHWEAVCGLLQSLGFTGIDDKRILCDDQVKVAFEASREKFIEIRSQSLLLFGFKSRAKEIPDLKSAIKAINAIVGNWCGYTINSERKLIGPKEKRVWKYSYQINRKPYKRRGFDNQEEVMARKLDNPEYRSKVPVLPSYKSKVSDEIQDFFDSIPITNNTTLEYAEREISDSSSNAIDEKALSLPEADTQWLKMPAQDQSIDSNKISEHREDHIQDVCYVNTIDEAGTAEKKISESLISLSSEFLIKSESDIDILILLLQQKYQMSQEKLDQWRKKIAFEMRDNQNYWKKERESMNEAEFLEYKRNFETKLGIPTTPHKRELKNKSLAFIEYA